MREMPNNGEIQGNHYFTDNDIADRLTPKKNGNGHAKPQDISTPFIPLDKSQSNGNGNGHHKVEVAQPDYLKGYDSMVFSDLVKSGQMREYYPFFEGEMDARITEEPVTKIVFNQASIVIHSEREGGGTLWLMDDNKKEDMPLKSNVAVRQAEDENGNLAMKFVFPQIDKSGEGKKEAIEVLLTKDGWKKRTLSRAKNQEEEDVESLNAADKIAQKWAIRFDPNMSIDPVDNPNPHVSVRLAPVLPRDYNPLELLPENARKHIMAYEKKAEETIHSVLIPIYEQVKEQDEVGS